MVSPQSGLLSSPACLHLAPMYKKKKNARIYFFKVIRFHISQQMPKGDNNHNLKKKCVT